MTCKFDLAITLTRSGHRHREAITAFEESRSIGQELFGGDGWSHNSSNSSVGHVAWAFSLREVGRDKDAEHNLVKGKESLGNDAASYYELARYRAAWRSTARNRRLRPAGGRLPSSAGDVDPPSCCQPGILRHSECAQIRQQCFSLATGPTFSSLFSTWPFRKIRSLVAIER